MSEVIQNVSVIVIFFSFISWTGYSSLKTSTHSTGRKLKKYTTRMYR